MSNPGLKILGIIVITSIPIVQNNANPDLPIEMLILDSHFLPGKEPISKSQKFFPGKRPNPGIPYLL